MLERGVRRHTASQALALRARIVLAAAGGEANTDIAERMGCTPATVGKWRRRYRQQGIDGLLDEPRVGRPRQVGDDKVEQIIVDALQQPPPDEARHWSTRAMAKHAQVSQTMVSRVWRTFGLKPHLTDTWKLSNADRRSCVLPGVICLDQVLRGSVSPFVGTHGAGFTD